jgi:redox-sensitive bicupin YhaK (pirin superfamily)
MSNLMPSPDALECRADAASAPSVKAYRARSADLGGGFVVRRALPQTGRRLVGPWCFLDHFGPLSFNAGKPMDVAPHPHIGLATVTYLFEGGQVHRDSLGNVQAIVPGDVNWMTAGHGIVHSERTGPHDRAAGHRLHGLQTWVALPKAHEQVDPSFSHHPKDSLPVIEQPGATMRLLAGTAFGRRAPTPTFSPMIYLAIDLAAGAALDLPPEHEERGEEAPRVDRAQEDPHEDEQADSAEDEETGDLQPELEPEVVVVHRSQGPCRARARHRRRGGRGPGRRARRGRR